MKITNRMSGIEEQVRFYRTSRDAFGGEWLPLRRTRRQEMKDHLFFAAGWIGGLAVFLWVVEWIRFQ